MERKRKPGAGRKPSKPNYDAKDVLSQQLEAAVALYSAKMGIDNTDDHPSLQAIADKGGTLEGEGTVRAVAHMGCSAYGV